MRRLQGATIAFVLAALSAPAGAAEISRVASSGEPRNPFDIDISIRWDRTQERAEITRERARPDGSLPAGTIVEGDDMRYVRTRNALVPRVAVGLYPGLELHLEMPYVLGDDREIRYGLDGGTPTGGVPPLYVSSIEANVLDADGQATCSAPCPLFRAPQTVYHGGRAGDLQAGLAWAIFDQRKDDTKPTWVVGIDVTFPTAKRYDPAAGRLSDWTSPNSVPGNPAPFGEKVWKWDAYTVLSKRIGPIDPYFRAHATAMARSSKTYSNCEHAAEMAARVPKEMNSLAPASCDAWGEDAEAELPWVAGITFGTELTPYEDARAEQRLSLDVRAFADYTSAHRFYNELTDFSGRLHRTQGFLEMGGLVGAHLRASRYLSLRASASLSTRTAHWLSGESLGRDGAWPSLAPGTGLTADPSAMNPNFDWRYDAPGRRFRISEVSVFGLSFAGVLQF